MPDSKPCLRCKGPTKVPATATLDVLCESCTKGNVLPAQFPRKTWAQRFLRRG